MAREIEKQGNIWDELFGEAARAIRDVREKVVEEPWYGRALTRGQHSEGRSVAAELGWVRADNEDGKETKPDREADPLGRTRETAERRFAEECGWVSNIRADASGPSPDVGHDRDR